MDIPYTAAHGTIRFSFSRYNDMSEVDEVLEVMPVLLPPAQIVAVLDGTWPGGRS